MKPFGFQKKQIQKRFRKQKKFANKKARRHAKRRTGLKFILESKRLFYQNHNCV
jgi:hypothetical protein